MSIHVTLKKAIPERQAGVSVSVGGGGEWGSICFPQKGILGKVKSFEVYCFSSLIVIYQ